MCSTSLKQRGRADCLCASYRHAGRRFASCRVTRSRWTFVMQAEKGVLKKKLARWGVQQRRAARGLCGRALAAFGDRQPPGASLMPWLSASVGRKS